MKLSDVQSGMQDGDLVLCRGRSLTALWIRFWTQSPFAHVGVIVWDRTADDRYLPHVIEARLGRRVYVRPMDEVIREDGKVSWYQLVDNAGDLDGRRVDRQRIAAAARSYVGMRYAPWWQFLRSFAWLSPKVADWLRIPDDTSPDRVFCSELAMGALRAGGVQWSAHCEPARMTPGDVALLPCFRRKGTVTL